MADIKDIYALHRRIQDWKDDLMGPVAGTFAGLGATPDIVSYAGLIAMFLFILSVKSHEKIALLLLIVGFFTDQFDGILARHMGRASDKGKFVDMVCDNFTFTLYLFGLIRGGLVSGLWGAVLIYFMITSKVLRSIYHSRFFESDWKFKAIAGATPNIAAAVAYLLFVAHVLWDVDYLNTAAAICGPVLFVDSALFYYRVLVE